MKDTVTPTPMKPLNPRQELFAEFVASGMSATSAYIKAGYNVTQKAAETAGPRLLGNVAVGKHIADLRKKASEKTEFTRYDMVQWLVSALKTPIGEIDENHFLAQEFTTEEMILKNQGGRIIKRRVKTVGKIECARLLCDIVGWKEPEKREINIGATSLDSVRERAKQIVSALARPFPSEE